MVTNAFCLGSKRYFSAKLNNNRFREIEIQVMNFYFMENNISTIIRQNIFCGGGGWCG